MCMYIYCSLLQAHAIYYTHLWLIYRIFSHSLTVARFLVCHCASCDAWNSIFSPLPFFIDIHSTSPHRIIISNSSRQLYDTRLLTSQYCTTTRISLTHWATWDYYECLNIDIRLDHFTCRAMHTIYWFSNNGENDGEAINRGLHISLIDSKEYLQIYSGDEETNQ